MFDFFLMAGNYESRKVNRFEAGELRVDTCAVSDSSQPYETAVSHPAYNEGRWVIVELYPTVEDAQEGHDKWVQIMTAPEIPAVLKDVSDYMGAILLRRLDPDALSFDATDD